MASENGCYVDRENPRIYLDAWDLKLWMTVENYKVSKGGSILVTKA